MSSVPQWTIAQFVQHLADRHDPSGGGVLAAVTLAGAAAVAQMVIATQTRRRHADQHRRQTFETARDALATLGARLLHQADADRDALRALLTAMRSAEHATADPRGATALRDAARAAAECPLATASDGIELLRQLARVAPLCPPFVASDLAAAASLGRAAIDAALAMAQANVPLLDEDGRRRVTAQIRSVREEADAIARVLAEALPEPR